MTQTILETRGISKSFGSLKASDSVSIDLRAGEIHAVIGPNGAGKSTLIHQICGGLRPDAGQVLLQGQDVTALSTAARARKGLGRTFQISALAMEDSVLENVMLGALGGQRAALAVLGTCHGRPRLARPRRGPPWNASACKTTGRPAPQHLATASAASWRSPWP